MESLQGKAAIAVVAIVLIIGVATGGVMTYVVFPRVVTETQTVDHYIDHYVYVNNTEYVYIKYGNKSSFAQAGNETKLFTYVFNLTYQIETNWTGTTKFTGYRYDFINNGTHILANFTVIGPPSTIFGVTVFQNSKEGFWFWLGEDYTNANGELTIVLKPVSVQQGWIYESETVYYNVGIGIRVEYNE